jgi:diguanylate cyclase (GGDEF)-like protein
LRERFYRSAAETLVLLHTAPGYDRRRALTQVAETLSSIMELPLVWVGRVEPGSAYVDVFAAAGPAAEYAAALRLSADTRDPGGLGPTGMALREGRARVTAVDAAEFAPWREAATAYGFGWHIVAAASTSDGGSLALSAYARLGELPLGAELLDWAQRLANEMVRFWDHQTLLERDIRMSRYRDAQRSIQRALLGQPDPAAVYHTLAHALVEIAGAVAVVVYRADVGAGMLHQVALAGPMADAIKHLTDQPSQSTGPTISTPTLAFMRGESVVRVDPATNPDTIAAWHVPALADVGAIGCWPVFSEPRSGAARVPVGVFSVVTAEADAFDTEMRGLLDEIADAAGLALQQHEQRRELRREQARQTYLALHDDLTHLPNRRALDRHLERLLERAREQARLLAVGILDVDDLKLFNDRYGHAVGDDILVEFATRVRSALRDEDYVARLGGDEFVLVFENLDRIEDLDSLLERVWHALQQPAVINGSSHQLSASLGMALFPLHAQASGAQLLRRADQAMYIVKTHKRTRPRWWALPPSEAGTTDGTQETHAPRPHGSSATALLAPVFELWSSLLPDLIADLYDEISAHEGIGRILAALRTSDADAVKRRLVQHLRTLLDPRLGYARQRERATQSGVFNAASGLEEVWLLELF